MGMPERMDIGRMQDGIERPQGILISWQSLLRQGLKLKKIVVELELIQQTDPNIEKLPCVCTWGFFRFSYSEGES
jgi:hypothetical protein